MEPFIDTVRADLACSVLRSQQVNSPLVRGLRVPRGGVRRGLGVAGFMALGEGGTPAVSDRPAADPTRPPREAGVLHPPGALCEPDQGRKPFLGAKGSLRRRCEVVS